MRGSVKAFLALAVFAAAGIGAANAYDDQTPRSLRGGYYGYGDQTPRSLQGRGQYQGYGDQTPRSLQGRGYGRRNDLNYLCSLGSQTPRSVRHLC